MPPLPSPRESISSKRKPELTKPKSSFKRDCRERHILKEILAYSIYSGLGYGILEGMKMNIKIGNRFN